MLWTNPENISQQQPSSQPWLRACPLPGRISHQWHGDVLQFTIPAFRTTLTTGPSTHTGSSQHHRPALHNHTSPPHSPRTFHQNITKCFTSTNEFIPSTSQLTPGAEKQAEVHPSPCKPAEEPGMADRPASSLPLLNYRPVRYFKGSFQNRGKGEKRKSFLFSLKSRSCNKKSTNKGFTVQIKSQRQQWSASEI